MTFQDLKLVGAKIIAENISQETNTVTIANRLLAVICLVPVRDYSSTRDAIFIWGLYRLPGHLRKLIPGHFLIWEKANCKSVLSLKKNLFYFRQCFRVILISPLEGEHLVPSRLLGSVVYCLRKEGGSLTLLIFLSQGHINFNII